MGSSNAQPPAPPGLTAEEKNLLEKQGLTVDKFNEILNQGALDSAETQALLKNLSGIYKQVTKPGTSTPGQTTYKDVVDVDAINLGLKNPNLGAGRTPVSAQVNGKLYAYKDLQKALTDENYAKQLGLVKTISETTPGTSTAETTAWELDPVAVEDLKKRVAAETASQSEILRLANERQIAALKGNVPISQGMVQRKADDFRLLKESAARRGILIDGDTPESATSQSTAGNELVGQFKRTYGLLEDSERQTAIYNPVQATSATGNTLNLATTNTSLGLLPAYTQLANSYAGLMTPYSDQRAAQYKSTLYGYGQGRQSNSALAGLLGTGAGIAAGVGGPWGYGLAAGLGGLGLLSALN